MRLSCRLFNLRRASDVGRIELPARPVIRDDFQAMGEHYTIKNLGQPKTQSLREFNLSTRLFRLPISYMLESTAFRSLNAGTKRQILARMKANLLGQGKLDRAAFTDEEIQDALAILSVIETQLTNGVAIRN